MRATLIIALLAALAPLALASRGAQRNPFILGLRAPWDVRAGRTRHAPECARQTTAPAACRAPVCAKGSFQRGAGR
jgi:hypothetical protein